MLNSLEHKGGDEMKKVHKRIKKVIGKRAKGKKVAGRIEKVIG